MKCWVVGHSWYHVNHRLGIEACRHCPATRHEGRVMIGKKVIKWFVLGSLLLLAPRAHAQVGQAVNVVDGPTGRKAYVTTNHALTMHCDNCGGSSGGGLTDAELRLTPVVVQVSSGTVAVSSVAGTVLVDGSAHAQPVTGVFYQATQPVSVAALPLPSGAATEATLLTRTKPSDQQHTIVDSSALPTDAATQTTLALIKAKTDNLDVALSTRTKPADSQIVSQATGTNLHTVVDSAPTTAVTNAGLSNLDVALSTRTKPADQQHAIVDSSALPSGAATDAAVLALTKPADQQHAILDSGTTTVTQATGTNLHTVVDSAPTTAVTNAGLSNLDVALSTRTKPADQQHAIIDSGTVSTITNPVTVTDGAGALNVIVDSGTTTVTQATGTNLHTVVDSAPTTAVTNAGLSNLDVALSTRTKPADQQHAILDSGTTVVTQPTGTNLHTVIDSGSVTVSDGSGALNVIVDSGTTTVTSATAANLKAEVVGTKTTNNAVPGATNIGALVGLANATAPTLTEGDETLLSQDLGSGLRTNLHVPFDPVGSQLFDDPFDNPLDTTNRWTSFSSGNGSAPTGNATLVLDGGSVVGLSNRQGASYVVSQATFPPQDPSWLVFSASALTGTWTSSATNIGDFIGVGTSPADPGVSKKSCTDCYGFEWGNGATFAAVVYIAGTRTTIQAITPPSSAVFHKYWIFYNGQKIYWFIDSLDAPVATAISSLPAVETLPILLSSWTTNVSIDPNQIQTLNVHHVSLGTTGRNGAISDPTFPWRRATVKAASTLPSLTDVALVTTQRDPLPAGTNVIGHAIIDSGTINVTDGSGALNVIVDSITPPALTKGTQGSTGFSVQPLTDAGRTFVTLTANAVAGVTSDTILTVTKNVQGTATTAQTVYTITNAKTLRCTALSLASRDGTTTTSWGQVNLRYNTAGSCTASSGLVATISAGGSAALAGSTGNAELSIPEGIEFRGDGTGSVCLSHISQATTNVETVTLSCYEY